MKDNGRTYKVRDIQNDLRVDWKVDLSYKRVWGGRNLTFDLLNGTPEDSFEQLPYYCHNLKIANKGTVTHIETDDAGRFKLVFIAFGVAVRSFIAFMRPLLIIDAAHLKGKYKGTNLLAVGMDGNNQIIPIATGVAQGETGEAWTVFLTKLKECIGVVPGLAIISDRHQSIIQACNKVFPDCFHGNCCRHLQMNCNLSSDRDKYIYWKACKSYTVENFHKAIEELRAVRPEAVKKLEEAGFEKWSRVYCEGNRYNYLTSNSAESINSLTRLVRKVPITQLMDYYRKLLQNWYFERREKYHDAAEFELSEWAAAKVQDRMLKSANWEVRGIAMCAVYQVLDTYNCHIVDFIKRECTCRQWQLSGLPCGHVCAVCRAEALTDCNQWALPWFTKTNLKGTYNEMVFPLADEADWVNPGNLQKVLPPVMGKKPGRPKNKDRIRSKNEELKENKCGRCGNKGHTREACMQPVPTIVQCSTTKRASNKGKSVLQDSVIEHASRNVLLDMSGNRKRKTGTEREVIVEPTADVFEEYFQNGRIYKDWDELSWMGEASNPGIGETSQPVIKPPSNNNYQGDMLWVGGEQSHPSIGQPSNNLYQGDLFWVSHSTS
ncbi:transposase, MuDR, MULE transposase domain protein [Artemisia annua]|uniref:Transposase, MuDR, MULE transposase domain protein n=1 Tax=Artemisia annua TaxID=35608 RepID=A0A2U1PB77_ARTAN|nr:transposase, MuDR, MULE transposase domain protein [Artemisia annua]